MFTASFILFFQFLESNLLRGLHGRWISNRTHNNTNWRMRKRNPFDDCKEKNKIRKIWAFSSFQWTTIEMKMKRSFIALEYEQRQQQHRQQQHHCRIENTILAPFGRSTWLCTIAYNNNKKNWSYRLTVVMCCVVVVHGSIFNSNKQSPLPPPLLAHCVRLLALLCSHQSSST